MNKHIYKNCEEISKNIDIKSFKNKTILITGANGLIGGFIAEFLYYLNLEHNSNIKIILSSKSVNPNNISKYILDNNNVFYISKDLSTSSKWRLGSEWDFKSKIDYCFYCAGYAQPSKFIDQPMDTLLLNTLGLESTFSVIFNNNSSATCIFLSSSEVYADNITNSSHKENDKLNINLNNKRNFYILGKINGEAIVNKFRQKGFNAISTRVSLCYGPGVDLSDTRVMSEFVKKGLSNDEHISLLDEGSALRRYLHITDFCKILFNITLKGKNNLYNIGGIEEISIYQMANIIADRFNKTVKIGTTINKVSSSAPKKVWVSMNRYLQEFDSLIFKPFGEGLNEFIDWYSKKINN